MKVSFVKSQGIEHYIIKAYIYISIRTEQKEEETYIISFINPMKLSSTIASLANIRMILQSPQFKILKNQFHSRIRNQQTRSIKSHSKTKQKDKKTCKASRRNAFLTSFSEAPGWTLSILYWSIRFPPPAAETQRTPWPLILTPITALQEELIVVAVPIIVDIDLAYRNC